MILQIIPCTHDLYACYKGENGTISHVKVICLALVEEKDGDETVRRVVGMSHCEDEIESVEDFDNFIEYVEKR